MVTLTQIVLPITSTLGGHIISANPPVGFWDDATATKEEFEEDLMNAGIIQRDTKVNLDLIDNYLGMILFETDGGRIFRSNASALDLLTILTIGVDASKPATSSANDGKLYGASDTKKLYINGDNTQVFSGSSIHNTLDGSGDDDEHHSNIHDMIPEGEPVGTSSQGHKSRAPSNIGTANAEGTSDLISGAGHIHRHTGEFNADPDEGIISPILPFGIYGIFDGVDGNVNIPSASKYANLFTSRFGSIGFNLNVSGLGGGGNGRILSHATGSDATGWWIDILDDPDSGDYLIRFTHKFVITDGVWNTKSVFTPLLFNTWYKFSFHWHETSPSLTYHLMHNSSGSSSAQGYAMNVVSLPSGAMLPITGNTNLYIGQKASGDNRYNGNLDEVRIWNLRVTAQEEVTRFTNNILTVSARGDEEDLPDGQLLGYYPFNEGSGLSLYDGAAGGTKSNGTLSGLGATWFNPALDEDDHHTRDHDTAHEPAGGDLLPDDAAAGTPSLRTLAQTDGLAIAAHTHP